MTLNEVLDRCVFESDGCISWDGAKDGKGYPHYGLEKQTHRVFRTLYEVFRGFVPAGRELHHVCDKKDCVNPYHVAAVTREEHMIHDGRMFHRDAKGRMLGMPGA